MISSNTLVDRDIVKRYCRPLPGPADRSVHLRLIEFLRLEDRHIRDIGREILVHNPAEPDVAAIVFLLAARPHRSVHRLALMRRLRFPFFVVIIFGQPIPDFDRFAARYCLNSQD